MGELPSIDSSLLVRTGFSSESAWADLLHVISTETVDGFRAYVEIVNQEQWRDAGPEYLRSALPEKPSAAVLFVADEYALSHHEFPILVVDLWGERSSFRCVARELWGPDNNLNLANMDFEEFAESVDPDGIFRGFPRPGTEI